MTSNLRELWVKLENRTDGWNWYWLSYGEKCYAFAVVTAFPFNESDDAATPPAGTMLVPDIDNDRLYVGVNGTKMLVDQQIASIEQQYGDAICQFIAGAFADAKQRFSNK